MRRPKRTLAHEQFEALEILAHAVDRLENGKGVTPADCDAMNILEDAFAETARGLRTYDFEIRSHTRRLR